MSSDETKLSERTVASALATLSLAQALMLEELNILSPEAGKRVADQLKGYVSHIENQHGKHSVDAATTYVTVQMLLRTIDGE